MINVASHATIGIMGFNILTSEQRNQPDIGSQGKRGK